MLFTDLGGRHKGAQMATCAAALWIGVLLLQQMCDGNGKKHLAPLVVVSVPCCNNVFSKPLLCCCDGCVAARR